MNSVDRELWHQIISQDIKSLQVPFIDYNGEKKNWVIEVHDLISDEIRQIFNSIAEESFPIHSILPIDNFDYDDNKSMQANNSSAYNFRFIVWGNSLSKHAYWFAVDINPMQNPYIKNEIILPEASNWLYDTRKKWTITKEIASIFQDHGWIRWWDREKPYLDYHHFEKRNKQVADIYIALLRKHNISI